MTLLGWATVIAGVIALCALVGAFVAIDEEQSSYDADVADADADAAIKSANSDYYTRRRLKALSDD